MNKFLLCAAAIAVFIILVVYVVLPLLAIAIKIIVGVLLFALFCFLIYKIIRYEFKSKPPVE